MATSPKEQLIQLLGNMNLQNFSANEVIAGGKLLATLQGQKTDGRGSKRGQKRGPYKTAD